MICCDWTGKAAMELVQWPSGFLARLSSFVDESPGKVGEAAEEGGRSVAWRGGPKGAPGAAAAGPLRACPWYYLRNLLTERW